METTEPIRRSPRLLSPSSSSSSQLISTQFRTTMSKKKKIITKPSNADEDDTNSMALSLHVFDLDQNGEEEEEPVPLNFYDPSVRRSSRFTTNKYRSSSPEPSFGNELPALPSLTSRAALRRSPTFSPAEIVDKDGKFLVGSKKKRGGSALSGSQNGKKIKVVLGELRKSPRLSSNLGCTKSGNSESSRKRSLIGKCLRKSPRLNPSSRGAFLALPAPKEELGKRDSEKLVLSEKSLRSRTIQMHVGNEKEKMVKKSTPTRSRKIEFQLTDDSSESTLKQTKSNKMGFESTSAAGDIIKKCLGSRKIDFNLPDDFGEDNCSTSEDMELDLPEEGPNGKCESDVLSVKCLRSRKIAFKVVADENDDQKPPSVNREIPFLKSNKTIKHKNVFIGEPISEEEAQKRWNWRYELKNSRSKLKNWVLNAGEEDETILNVQSHFAQAKVASGSVLSIGDCALIKGEGSIKHIGRILEFFKTMEGEDYFRVQWFYRAEETVMQETAAFHDKSRVFRSTIENDNPLDCIISKVNIIKKPPTVDLKPDTDQANFYYDMEYCVEYSTFRNLQTDDTSESHHVLSGQCFDAMGSPLTSIPLEGFSSFGSLGRDLTLLDLYSGCGGMSTGLCFGAKLAGVNLVTRWAVDLEKSACNSVKLNHPETLVRNESAEDFLELLKRWEELSKGYVFNGLETTTEARTDTCEEGEDNESSKSDSDQEFEVAYLKDICYGDPNETGKYGLHFKVRWRGYGPEEDTWEPIEGLSNCQEKIRDFVRNGLRCKILPLPGAVDVICGGPPCQGISGYNRYRNTDAPLTDEKNQQIVVFMDIVEFLKPKYVLMENVSDILRFDGASLGRYALSRLVHMKYQARLGTVAAGCYGLPQFRLRVFIWGAVFSEKLPPFPLPTHDVVVRHWPPPEFERNTVAYDEGQARKIEDAVILRDAISDLPAVTNEETRDVMEYSMPPETEFQKYIRLTKEEMMGLTSIHSTATKEHVLYDHRPLRLNEDNYLRVCQVPHRKGACFRDFPGVVVGEDNVVRRDTLKPVFLPSGEPMAPDCVFTFEKGKSKRPYARLWWDETVPTVLTLPYLRAQAILHPEQDRVLTVRECARLQGFPDFYRFCGTLKERYCQVGNAVSIPVGKALGYALGMAFQKLVGEEPLMTLPPNFAFQKPYSVTMLF